MRSTEERAALAAKWRDHNLQKKTPKAAAAQVHLQQIAPTEEEIREQKRIDALLDAVPVGPDNYKTLQVPGAWYRRYVGDAA